MSGNIQVVHKLFDILELLAESSKPMGPTEIANSTGLSRSSVHRLLQTMHQRGYVDKISPEGSYAVGLKLIEVVSYYINGLELQTEARPYIQELSETLNLTIYLGILEGNEVVYIDKRDIFSNMRLYLQIGHRVPAYCSSLGKCLLSRLSGEELEETMGTGSFQKFTERTITNLRDLKEQLRMVRTKGWAMDDREFTEDNCCIGAPIFDYRGAIIAAVSASASPAVLTTDKISYVAEKVRNTGMAISKRLGYIV